MAECPAPFRAGCPARVVPWATTSVPSLSLSGWAHCTPFNELRNVLGETPSARGSSLHAWLLRTAVQWQQASYAQQDATLDMFGRIINLYPACPAGMSQTPHFFTLVPAGLSACSEDGSILCSR